MHDFDIHIVCMLVEGHYFHGAAALCNSLLRNGFKGEIVVGYRGALPAVFRLAKVTPLSG